jgi:hypothetical protein
MLLMGSIRLYDGRRPAFIPSRRGARASAIWTRFGAAPARLDPEGRIVTLERQDRSLWDGRANRLRRLAGADGDGDHLDHHRCRAAGADRRGDGRSARHRYELESQRRELPDPDTDLREVYARRSQVDPAEVVRLDELRGPTREAG